MKKQNFKIYVLAALLIGFYSCNSNDDVVTDSTAAASQFKVINVTHHDGHPFSTGVTTSSTGKYVANPGGGVMMQAFYWDVPSGGTWWNTVGTKVTEWSNAGIGSIWLPPASKAQNGAFSMGYDPTDYFDFGDFNQNGSIETRFGSKTELVSLITKAHTENMQVYADIVINHNSGGQLENNPFTGTQTYTNFTGVASGKFPRTSADFTKIHSEITMKEHLEDFLIYAMPLQMSKIGFGKELTA